MNEKTIENITKIPTIEQNKLIKRMTKIDIKSKCTIMKDNISIFHQLNSQYSYINHKSILTYCAFILSLQKNLSNLNSFNLNVIKIRSKKDRNNIKRQKILSYWSIIRKLHIDEKMSFRDISEYLLKYHKFNISYSSIYTIWNEIEKGQENDKY